MVSPVFREALERDPSLAANQPGQSGPPARSGRAGHAELPAALAYHWYAALDLPRALPASIDAAAHAMDSYAPAEALRHLERALEIWPRVADARERTGLDRVEVSKRAAEAAYRSGALDRAQSLFADAMAELGGDAAAAVSEAHALAERLGAAPVAAEAAALARRARLSLDPAAAGRPGEPAGDPAGELARFGLTDREREVLLLVAAGHSNPEIARTLFISAKTASVHVSNILAKLGVGGRVEAAAVVHRLGGYHV